MRISPGGDGPDPADRAAERLAQLAAAIGGRPPPADDPADADGGTSPWWSDHTRLRMPPEPPDTPPAPPAVLPEPGRHATRRRETDLRAALRERLPATGLVGAQHLTVVALAVALVVGGTAWWLLRDRGGAAPVTTAAAAPPLVAAGASPLDSSADLFSTAPSATGTPTGPVAPATTGSPTSSVTVDVVGKVRRPGIAVLRAGSRVVDAIKAAGGARRGVDLSSLNLARVLVDGEQIAVGVRGAGGAGASATGGGAAPPGGLVNLNTATADQLEALPEVGPVTAQAIVTYREQNGGFTSIDQLLDVQGIGDKTMAQLEPYVTI